MLFNASKGSMSNIYVAYNSDFGNCLENVKPDTKILCSFSDWPSSLTDKFITIDADFENVVCQRKEWSQWKSSDENCNKTKLNH